MSQSAVGFRGTQEGKPVKYHNGHSCRNKHIYHRHSEGVFLRSIHGYCISNTSRPLESERMKSRAHCDSYKTETSPKLNRRVTAQNLNIQTCPIFIRRLCHDALIYYFYSAVTQMDESCISKKKFMYFSEGQNTK
ncbi:hypothetical protein L204_106121 [Cryptococcus depauperatus]